MSPMTVGRVTLEGRHVRLEPLGWEHLDGLIATGTDPSLYEWTVDTLGSPEAMTGAVRQALAAEERGEELPFATVEAATGRVVGTTRFLGISRPHRRAEIGGTRIGRPWQRTPINTEAKLLMLQHAFEVWEANRIEFKTDARNLRSRAALTRIGAMEEGTLRQHMVNHDGHVRDSVYFGIIRPDWPGVRDHLLALLARPWTQPIERNNLMPDRG